MCESFLDSVVAIDCGSTLGTYQGRVSAVDKYGQTISIVQVQRNGETYGVPEVTLNACDIHDLRIVTLPPASLNDADASFRTLATPEGDNVRLTPEHMSPVPYGTGTRHLMPGEQASARVRTNSENCPGRKPTTPRKIDGRRGRGAVAMSSASKEDCFSAPVESFLGEFDFEKNLALFDKQAVFEEIDGLAPGGAKSRGGGGQRIAAGDDMSMKYRSDENVLPQKPAVYRQIRLTSETPQSEYVTDSGLVVPSVSAELRQRLFDACIESGLSRERQVEAIGRSVCEMVLQLLGGSHRLSPQNQHQRPSVVVICGRDMRGAQGVCCARHLAAHHVNAMLFLMPDDNRQGPMHEIADAEMRLYDLTTGQRTHNVKDLPKLPTDVIIDAATTFSQAHSSCRSLAQWQAGSKAPTLALDPVSPTDAKWTMCVGLPLANVPASQQLYLCDVGIPQTIFKRLGIAYQSPFIHKFVVTLHPR